jgi:nucleotide-binding universal stress UspA family protein
LLIRVNAKPDDTGEGRAEVPSKINILVPLNTSSRDLNGVYHALALAERMDARVIILTIDLNGNSADPQIEGWVQDALQDLLQTASRQGLPVSCHIAQDQIEKEIPGLIAEENIALLVFGAGDRRMADALQGLRPKISAQLIQVREKGTAHFV